MDLIQIQYQVFRQKPGLDLEQTILEGRKDSDASFSLKIETYFCIYPKKSLSNLYNLVDKRKKKKAELGFRSSWK